MFGQVVVGPPGSGKTTYCHGVRQIYAAQGRPVTLVNLDPGNSPHFSPNSTRSDLYDIDISSLVTQQDAMQEHGLGPNGALLYCLDVLAKNVDWLLERLHERPNTYILFDCPGQVELFTSHDALRSVVLQLGKHGFRLCCINLVDAHLCSNVATYVSMLVVSLQAMLQLELPHINVLAKIDLAESQGPLAFSLDYYTQVQDPSYLLAALEADPFTRRYAALSRALVELVTEYGLVGFVPLCISDKTSVVHLTRQIDKANGYVYGDIEGGSESLFMTAERQGYMEDSTRYLAEKYLTTEDDEYSDDNELMGDIVEK